MCAGQSNAQRPVHRRGPPSRPLPRMRQLHIQSFADCGNWRVLSAANDIGNRDSGSQSGMHQWCATQSDISPHQRIMTLSCPVVLKMILLDHIFALNESPMHGTNLVRCMTCRADLGLTCRFTCNLKVHPTHFYNRTWTATWSAEPRNQLLCLNWCVEGKAEERKTVVRPQCNCPVLKVPRLRWGLPKCASQSAIRAQPHTSPRTASVGTPPNPCGPSILQSCKGDGGTEMPVSGWGYNNTTIPGVAMRAWWEASTIHLLEAQSPHKPPEAKSTSSSPMRQAAAAAAGF